MMIKHVQANDTGSYECQVTTDEGGILSHQVKLYHLDGYYGWLIPAAQWLFLNLMFFNICQKKVELKVETPEAFILADEEYHIDTGSSLSLVCIIEKATEPPAYVFW